MVRGKEGFSLLAKFLVKEGLPSFLQKPGRATPVRPVAGPINQSYPLWTAAAFGLRRLDAAFQHGDFWTAAA